MKIKMFISVSVLALLLLSCAHQGAERLMRAGVSDIGQVSGSYTLVLYGNRYGNDVRTVAILDREDDAYTFEPYATAHNYRKKSGLTGSDALQEAANFVGSHSAYRTNRVSGIEDRNGTVLGYEVRPLYLRSKYGYSDMLDISYFLTGQTVSVFIELKGFLDKSFRKRDDIVY